MSQEIKTQCAALEDEHFKFVLVQNDKIKQLEQSPEIPHNSPFHAAHPPKIGLPPFPVPLPAPGPLPLPPPMFSGSEQDTRPGFGQSQPPPPPSMPPFVPPQPQNFYINSGSYQPMPLQHSNQPPASFGQQQNQMVPESFSSESSFHGQAPPQTPLLPYFELPAGLLTQLVKMEDFEYEPIDPNEIKLPVLTPPDERLLSALENFYKPPSHETPRNAEGWEKLGFYEYFKAKAQSKKEVLEKRPLNERNRNLHLVKMVSNDKDKSQKLDSSSVKTENSQSSVAPQRKFKEFKEEKPE